MLRKFAEPACSPFATLPGLLARLLQPSRVSSLVRVYFYPTQVGRACLLPSHNLAGSAHPCEFTFMHRKFVEPPRSCLLQPCRVSSHVQVYFYASRVRPACSLLLHATLPSLIIRASLISYYTSSPSLLAHAYCNVAWSAHLVRVHFHASQVHRDCSHVLLATLPGLLSCASLISCYASSPDLLARAYCNLARSARPCEFTFMFRKFAEPVRSCFLQPCRVCSQVLVHFQASQVRLAYWLVLLVTLPGLLTHASLISCNPSLPSLQARAYCNHVGLAHLCEFTFILRKFAKPARSPLTTLPGQLTRASLLLCIASSSSLLALASCNLAESAHTCKFTFTLREFAKPARSCFMQPCRV
ncbi:hypothetical protein CDL15_Pgr023670 [Punica granatum]|uniref:Uncharacterized protein n=1 Tax=Punica granatum TaxID=22663 RepID=A0A218XY09_PUNGR|nr:hypothetical protein CDL15_Pgr023670 [Punica granatum]